MLSGTPGLHVSQQGLEEKRIIKSARSGRKKDNQVKGCLDRVDVWDFVGNSRGYWERWSL